MKAITKSVSILVLMATLLLLFCQYGFGQSNVEEQMALIDGNYPNKTKVARYRYLLATLEKKTGDPKQRIADMTVKSQELLRRDYGKDASLLELMEGVNQVISSKSKVPYANVIAAHIMIIGQ